jgi:hypothetical protein
MIAPIVIAYKPTSDQDSPWSHLPQILNINSPTAKLVAQRTMRQLEASGFDTAMYELTNLMPADSQTKTG